MDDGPLVRVEVMVNFDSLRKGQVGEVELNGRIEMLIRRGYLKLLGHVDVPAVEVFPVAPEVPEPPAPTEAPAKRIRPSRAKTKVAATPEENSDGDSPGGTELE